MNDFDALPLRPQDDGRLYAPKPVLVPFMAPRLQGDLHPDGRLSLSVWGAGHVATISLAIPQDATSYAPNHAAWRGGGLFVARSKPVLLVEGAALRRAVPAARGAWWSQPEPRQRAERHGDRQVLRTGWGVTIIERTPSSLRIAAGDTLEEAETGFELGHEDIRREALDYVACCDAAPGAEPLVRTMVSQSLHAGLSSVRRNAAGDFAGLAAGQSYSAPARTYYRDGYWTLQILLDREPEAVKGQIEQLAAGLQSDGEAPSGVILTGDAQSERWERVRRNEGIIKEQHLRPGDWWSDHFDSPLFFILTVADYTDAVGDREPLERHWPLISAIVRRYAAFDRHDNGLPYKPRNDRDWADNVFRHGYVSYDIGLWIGALDAVARLGAPIDPALAKDAEDRAARARASVDAELLTPDGHYADYGDKRDFQERHLTLDSLTLLRYRAVSPERAGHVLRRVGEVLETRHNDRQPYGDWGVMCAWPAFERRADTRDKTAFAFRYHNGSDWPYLTGLYAEQLVDYEAGDPTYALTRWWRTCLENGWCGAVEYFAPPWGRGSLLQGWSAMPAYVWLSRLSR